MQENILLCRQRKRIHIFSVPNATTQRQDLYWEMCQHPRVIIAAIRKCIVCLDNRRKVCVMRKDAVFAAIGNNGNV